MASKTTGALALSILVAASTGCGGHSIREVETPESACVYGNIVVDDGYVPNNVIMHEVGVVYAPPSPTKPPSFAR